MFLSKLIALGTEQQNYSATSKIRLVNIISLLSICMATGYTLNYLLVLQQPFVALINSFFVIAYGVTFLFMHFYAHKNAKIWFFMVLISHLFICTNVYVTKDSGFHLYYFLVPTGAFLLFDFKDKLEKVALSVLALVLMIYCENTLNLSPLIVLSEGMNNMLYQSVIITNMVEVVVVIIIFNNQLERNEAKLMRQATTDALTSIANRHHFFEQGEVLLTSSNISQRPFSLILLDFDLFKIINDNYGHGAGDLCLVEISDIIQKYCRQQDLFARVGGEEFVIALPDTTALEANKIAERMRSSIEQHTMFISDDTLSHNMEAKKSFSCTVSFGVADKMQENMSLKNLMLNADKALYSAKNEGRNRVKVFEEIA